jgi:hypothetical protein
MHRTQQVSACAGSGKVAILCLLYWHHSSNQAALMLLSARAHTSLFFADTHVTVLCVAVQNKQSEFCAPLTSFDWNDVDPKRLGTSSIDTTCTIWVRLAHRAVDACAAVGNVTVGRQLCYAQVYSCSVQRVTRLQLSLMLAASSAGLLSSCDCKLTSSAATLQQPHLPVGS